MESDCAPHGGSHLGVILPAIASSTLARGMLILGNHTITQKVNMAIKFETVSYTLELNSIVLSDGNFNLHFLHDHGAVILVVNPLTLVKAIPCEISQLTLTLRVTIEWEGLSLVPKYTLSLNDCWKPIAAYAIPNSINEDGILTFVID